jgi:hypothetical protein
MANKELGCEKKTSYMILSYSETAVKSVARTRLGKTENPSACVTVNCKVYGNSNSAVIACSPELCDCTRSGQ